MKTENNKFKTEDKELWQRKERLTTLNEQFQLFKRKEAIQRSFTKGKKIKINWETYYTNKNPQTLSTQVWKSFHILKGNEITKKKIHQNQQRDGTIKECE